MILGVIVGIIIYYFVGKFFLKVINSLDCSGVNSLWVFVLISFYAIVFFPLFIFESVLLELREIKLSKEKRTG